MRYTILTDSFENNNQQQQQQQNNNNMKFNMAGFHVGDMRYYIIGSSRLNISKKFSVPNSSLV